jgi:ATP-dependent DNA helicase RecQ
VSAPGVARLAAAADAVVGFSVLELKEEYRRNLFNETATTAEIEDALYYLLKIGALRIEGGFLVIYNAMRIERLVSDSRTQYRKEHYAKLEEYYQNKRRQIHIVGEYARRLIEDYREAMSFVDDYFSLGWDIFLHKYFRGRREEISRNITPAKFKRLFGDLSPGQLRVIKDQDSPCIVVAAGPGSGKTKLLTHKLASLYMMEDVKHEQMLMLTFSSAAATEFKSRLLGLMGNAANFIQIMTFHSYCFDLLGKVGDLEKSDQILERTVGKIKAGEVDLTRLTKTALVIDEAQDMSEAEYALVEALLAKNSDLRVIAVGDDDQNIYGFRGSSSAYFESLLKRPGARKYELVDNYRARANLVAFANQFAGTISRRFKTAPIQPMIKENGVISVTKLTSNNIETPVVSALLDARPAGAICIVTRTNEEALNIIGLLQSEGVAARQIQANNDFNLLDLVELRDFIAGIEADPGGYTVSEEIWQREKSRLIAKYAGSDNLPGALKLLGDFEKTRNNTRYKSDVRQFIRESRLEDFIGASEGTVLVSTIHQTKGREFDHVFLALSRFPHLNDEARRAIYVALTRAKESLRIFCAGDYFDHIAVDNMTRSWDRNAYPAPALICEQLTHRDVVLNHFAACAKELDAFRSGQELTVREWGCFWGDRLIIRFAAKFRGRVAELMAQGYSPLWTRIRHIVFWRGKDQQGKNRADEIKIALPNVEFVKAPAPSGGGE